MITTADLRRSLSHFTGKLLGLLGHTYVLEPRTIVVERAAVHVPGLPAHLDGYTIGVLSDLHLGPLVRVEQVRRAAALLASLQPDLVVVAGDLVSTADAIAGVDQALEPVSGAFAVLGNWEYGRHALAVRDSRTVHHLVNAGRLVAPGLWLGGVDDVLFGRPSITAAMAGAPPGAVRLLLAHEPDLADWVRPDHQVALQISGHSHGGQIRLPLIGPTILPSMGRKYPAGLQRAPHCQVYTSRGLGVAHLPIRILCPPEIGLLTLRTAPA